VGKREGQAGREGGRERDAMYVWDMCVHEYIYVFMPVWLYICPS
jgi:hypothetical protein